jgi:methionyl-tRNA synthetase
VCPEGILDKSDEFFLDKIKIQVKDIERDMDLIEIKSALKGVMSVARLANQYMQENKPWQNSKQRADSCVYVLLNVIKDLGILCGPFMPGVSNDIFTQLNIEPKRWNNLFESSIKSGHKISEPKPLFEKLDEKKVEELKKKYSGIKKGKSDETKNVSLMADNNENKTQKSFSDLDLRVGLVKEAIAHPNADKLLVIKVDIGEKQIQLVAGLKKFYSPEEITGKKIIVVNNLKHANLRGFESQGMLLAGGAREENGKDNHDGFHGILYVEKSKIGTKVKIKDENSDKAPKQEITIDEFYSNYKIVVKDGKAYYNGKVLIAEDEEIMCDRINEGVVR